MTAPDDRHHDAPPPDISEIAAAIHDTVTGCPDLDPEELEAALRPVLEHLSPGQVLVLKRLLETEQRHRRRIAAN